MDKITIQSLNALFDHIQSPKDTVLWIRNADGNRQLYLSPKFEKLWGRKTEMVFSNPAVWLDYLHDEDRIKIANHIQQRYTHPDSLERDEMLYRIRDVNDHLHFMKGMTFALMDDEHHHIGFTGISTKISEQEWNHLNELSKQHNQEDNAQVQFKKYLFEVLRNELRIQPTVKQDTLLHHENCILINKGKPVDLTQREAQCLHYLAKGKSAKVTANVLQISPRTVEFHLNNLKLKAECRTKLELLSKTMIKVE